MMRRVIGHMLEKRPKRQPKGLPLCALVGHDTTKIRRRQCIDEVALYRLQTVPTDPEFCH